MLQIVDCVELQHADPLSVASHVLTITTHVLKAATQQSADTLAETQRCSVDRALWLYVCAGAGWLGTP
jgi:hypothetical protein